MPATTRAGGAAAVLSQAYLNQKKDAAMSHFQENLRGDEEAQNLLNEADFEDERVNENKSSNVKKTLWTTAILLTSTGTLGIHILVMATVGTVASIISGVVASLVAVGVFVAQIKLEDVNTLAEVQNVLRMDVNRISQQNSRLAKSLEELNVQTFCLKEAEQRLKDMTEDQDLSVKSLVSLLKESQLTIDQMKKMVRCDIISDLFGVILKEERDGNGEFSDREVERLLIFMRDLPAVKVNEALLKEAIAKDRSIATAMTLVIDIGQKGEQAGDQIFVIDESNKELQRKVIEQAV